MLGGRGAGGSQWLSTPPVLPPLTDLLWDEGHEAAADAPGVDGRDVEQVGHHGEHLDVWDAAAGGFRLLLDTELALPEGGHAKPEHGPGTVRPPYSPLARPVPRTPVGSIGRSLGQVLTPASQSLQ